MMAIPAELVRRFGIKPGHRLDWQVVEGKVAIPVAIPGHAFSNAI